MIGFFWRGVKNTMKYRKYSLTQAILEEYYMMFCVMGIKLYIKYANGTAVFEN